MAGFYCSICNRVYLCNTADGLCAECPERLYDLSTPEGRAQAHTAEGDEKARARHDAFMPSVLAAVAGGAAGVFAASAATRLSHPDGTGDLEALFVGGVIGGGVAAGLVWWLKTRRAKSGLTEAPLEEHANLCAACGSAALDGVADKVYQCRDCGYQGGEELADRNDLNIDLHGSLAQILRSFGFRLALARKVPDQASAFIENVARYALRVATEIMRGPPRET